MLRLLCFHCAGCDGTMFTSTVVNRRREENALVEFCRQRGVELRTPILSGRAERQRFALKDLREEAQRICAEELPKVASTTSVALVGHSMGAVLCYEVARRFLAAGVDLKFVVVSSCGDSVNPKRVRRWPQTRELSDDQLKHELLAHWGMDQRAADPRVWDMIKVKCRTDMEVLDSYAPEAAGESAETLESAAGGENVRGIVMPDLPVIGLVGSEDHYIKLADMQTHETWAGCRYRCEEIAGADHALYGHAQSRAAVFEVIIRCLEEALEGDDEEIIDCF